MISTFGLRQLVLDSLNDIGLFKQTVAGGFCEEDWYSPEKVDSESVLLSG
mgnify:CR=1 FL=1